MEIGEYRVASLEHWNGSAEGWDRHSDRVERFVELTAEALIDGTSPRPGETVLELACGPGGVGLRVAPLVGASGSVILSDFAEEMVAVARRRAQAAGAGNVEARVLDAEDLDLPDQSVDVVLCRMGLMLMADRQRATREMTRVLRPGGRLGVAVWADAGRNPWISVPMRSLMEQLGAPPPEPGVPGVFSMSDPAVLRQTLESAGLEEVDISEVKEAHTHDSFAVWWDQIREMTRPFGQVTAAMDEEAREGVRRRMREDAEEYTGPDGSLSLPSMAIVAIARRH